MREAPKESTQPENELSTSQEKIAAAKAEVFGRILFMLGGGVLLATLVSCACGSR